MLVVRPSVGLSGRPSVLPSGRPYIRPTCERDILELFHHSTSNLKYDIRPAKTRTLLILGHVRKTKMAAIKLFNKYAIDTPCDVISLEPINQSTSNLVYDVILPKGRTLMILGHVRKL